MNTHNFFSINNDAHVCELNKNTHFGIKLSHVTKLKRLINTEWELCITEISFRIM